MNYEYEISVAIPNTLVESFEEETEEIGNIVKAVGPWWRNKIEDAFPEYTYYELDHWKFYDGFPATKLLIDFCTAHNKMQTLLGSHEDVGILRMGEDHFDNAYECRMAVSEVITYGL